MFLYIRYHFFIILALLNSACSDKQQTPKPVSLEPVQSVSELNDSTFIGDVWNMKFANNRFYLADNTPQILQLGPDLNLLGGIYKNGKGPGEFSGISDICVVNDSLFVYDRPQAKILVYDDTNHFAREVRLPDASGFNMTVDDHNHIFLSTSDQKHPITELDAHGQKVMAFGRNTIKKDSKHFRRNSRLLFIHTIRLIAIGISEPLAEVYRLDGTFISKTTIAPPEIHNLITWAKKENEDSYSRGLPVIFNDATVFKNTLYLMAGNNMKKHTHTWKRKFTYLFKYKLEKDGHLTFVRTFKLFRPDHDKLLYGLQVEAVGDHKLVVYDLMGKSLLVFKDKRL